MKRYLVVTVVMMMVSVSVTAFAANEPSITGEAREGIQQAMQAHVEETSVNGLYTIYDAVADNLLRLNFDEMHDGIAKTSDFYISCAFFKDSAGTFYDIDFLVVEKDGKFDVLQGIVHKVGDQTRDYHLEN